MAQEQSQQTEEQRAQAASEAATKAAQLWQGDFDEADLTIPYKHAAVTDEVSDENNENNISTAAATEEDEQNEESAQSDISTDIPEVITVQDPGEYTPADYSFEVTNKDGKTIKISTPEEAEQFASDDENFQTARDLKNFLSKSNKMEAKLDRDYERWETQKQAFEQQKNEEDARLKYVQDTTAGFEYLITKKLLPELTEEERTTDWRELKMADHPNVKAHMDLINYMNQENENREKAGVPLFGSVLDAYNAYQLEHRETQDTQARQQAATARKTAGARVAATSPNNQQPYVPKGIAVGRTDVFRRGSQAQWQAILENQQ